VSGAGARSQDKGLGERLRRRVEAARASGGDWRASKPKSPAL